MGSLFIIDLNYYYFCSNVEPGLVKFESVGISRPSSSADCLSAVRGGSAGRVERSLQVARKKELEDELPRQNGAGPDVSNGK